MTTDKDLTIWTIYDQPADFPGGFIVRPWTITAGNARPGAARTARTLDDARAEVPAGLFRMDRQPDDDPAILESWI